jgi:hypothetical protein
LAKQLDKLYSKYIEKEWKPSVLRKIKEDRRKLNRSLKKIGPVLTVVENYDVVEIIITRVCDILTSNISHCHSIFITESFPKYGKSNSYQEYMHYNDLINNIDEVINIICKDFVLKKLEETVFSKEKPYKLERFEELKCKIYTYIENGLLEMFNKNKTRIVNSLYAFLDGQMSQLKTFDQDGSAKINFSFQNIFNVLKFLVLHPLNKSDFFSSEIRELFCEIGFVENDTYKEMRLDIENKIKQNDYHSEKRSKGTLTKMKSQVKSQVKSQAKSQVKSQAKS